MKFEKSCIGRSLAALLAGVAVCSLAGIALADDVEVTSDTANIDLDSQSGSTIHVATGVSVGPAANAINATIQAWTLTNDGSVSGSNTVRMTKGGSVTNNLGAGISSTSSAIILGTSGVGGAGTVSNAGTITGGTAGDTVLLYGGGTVTNLATGTITAANSSNAVSISGGTVRTVINSGLISNTGSGFSSGVLIQGAGATNTITNNATGQIVGGYNGIYGSSTASLIVDNAGSISSTRASAIEATAGGTITNSGTITSSGPGTASNLNGILTRNTAAAEVVNSGTISGATNAINFTASGGGSTGATHTVRLQTGSVLNGNVLGGTGTDNLILEGSGTETISKFSSFETVTLNGAEWTLSGVGSFSTSATVQSGILHVAGTLTTAGASVTGGRLAVDGTLSGPVTVGAAGTLGGTGTVGTVTANGKIAPGNSIGTLNVAGDTSFNSGSSYEVEVNAAGASDLLLASGAATIDSNAAVSVLAETGSYSASTVYTILTATGGVSGTFGPVTANFAFLDPTLSYDANNVYLTLLRNSLDYGGIAETPNQFAAGMGVDSLGGGNPVYDAVLMLSEDEARYAFDQLSGEIHASARGALLEESRMLRETAWSRLEDTRMRPERNYWANGFGIWGRMDGDGNAAALEHSSGGFLAGADWSVAGDWRVGVLAGYSHSDFSSDARHSGGDAETVHFGVYGGTMWGALSFRSGLGASLHDLATERVAGFTGFSETLTASYGASTMQAFGELGYDLRAGETTFEPFANLALVSLSTDGFSEAGGDAALSSAGGTTTITFATLGVKAKAPVDLGGVKAQVSGMAGWRHGWGDTTPVSTLAFAGGDPFEIAGAPIGRDVAVVEAGIDFALAPAANLGVFYSGQFGSGVTSQTLRARLNVKF